MPRPPTSHSCRAGQTLALSGQDQVDGLADSGTQHVIITITGTDADSPAVPPSPPPIPVTAKSSTLSNQDLQ